jgi:hypothetical protein
VHAAPDANLFDLFPARPPWKYRRVYARLLSAAQRAVERCWELQQPGRPTQGRDAKGRHLPIVMPDK